MDINERLERLEALTAEITTEAKHLRKCNVSMTEINRLRQVASTMCSISAYLFARRREWLYQLQMGVKNE